MKKVGELFRYCFSSYYGINESGIKKNQMDNVHMITILIPRFSNYAIIKYGVRSMGLNLLLFLTSSLLFPR